MVTRDGIYKAIPDTWVKVVKNPRLGQRQFQSSLQLTLPQVRSSKHEGQRDSHDGLGVTYCELGSEIVFMKP